MPDVAKITIDGQEIEAPEGAVLLEVAKQNGFYIPALCYIDGLPPYAGCRMCLVEVEGGRGPQLSCTTRVTDGMEVRTNTPQLADARRAVLSLILANHSDRCLTCHRRVHCMPGDICLRDGVVTHRCLTCSKNYRCELQRACELVDTVNYEPWIGEERTFYRKEQPPADRANPFLEFDPQMCIICTRCLRACDEIRHTGAIGLARRGFETRIIFGAEGRVDESNCDFCGACIDLCPTATLMEKPNKWVGQADEWVATACNSCSVGCTLSMGVREGRPVIVRPDALNPVSFTQICVRGRFHYDAVEEQEWLTHPLVKKDGALVPSTWEEALDEAVSRLAEIRERDGADAMGFLGSPLATNEENYLLQKLARAAIGTNNVDYSGGPVAAAVAESLRAAFGSEALPADMTEIATAKTLVVAADDLESSHNVAALRVKDAVVNGGARLIVVSPHWGEVCDFAETWLRPYPGNEAATLQALARLVAQDAEVSAKAQVEGVEALGDGAHVPGVPAEALENAAALLIEAAKDRESHLAIIVAPGPLSALEAGDTARAAANLAIVARGRQAARSLYVLPVDANATGARDMGIAPDRLPGLRSLSDAAAGEALAKTWGADLPPAAGLDFNGMIAAARQGKLKALVALKDNPLLAAAAKASVREALGNLQFLLVIDNLLTDTARSADIVLPEVTTYGKEGTFTSADRRLLRLNAAMVPLGEARQSWRVLAELGARLGEKLSRAAGFAYESARAVMEEIASVAPLYADARYDSLQSGKTRAVAEEVPQATIRPLVSPPRMAPADGVFTLTTGRGLYTSLEGAAVHSVEADKLHREEFAEMNPDDAARLGVKDGDKVVLVSDRGELAIAARVTPNVLPGVLFVPLHYAGGAVTAFFPGDADESLLPQVKVAVQTPA